MYMRKLRDPNAGYERLHTAINGITAALAEQKIEVDKFKIENRNFQGKMKTLLESVNEFRRKTATIKVKPLHRKALFLADIMTPVGSNPTA